MHRPLFTKKEIGQAVDGIFETALAATIIGAAAVMDPKKTVPPLAKLAARSLEQSASKAVLFGRFVTIHAKAVGPVVSEAASRVYYTTTTAAAIAVVLPVAFALNMYDEQMYDEEFAAR